MNWQERMRQVETQKLEKQKEAEEAKKLAVNERKKLVESFVPQTIQIIDAIGVKNLLESIKEEVWKKGEVRGPFAEDSRTNEDFQMHQNGLVAVYYVLLYEYPAWVTVEKKVTSQRTYTAPWEGGNGWSGGGEETFYERVEGTEMTRLRAGIVRYQPKEPESYLPILAYVNKPRPRSFEGFGGHFGTFEDANKWFQTELLRESINREKNQMLPEQIDARTKF